MDEALAFLERSPYGNQASLFTSSGAAARRFRYEAPAGNIGINIGVAAPMAYFPFSGWKDSFFGIMHAQGRDAIEFYTEKKIVVERWAELGKMTTFSCNTLGNLPERLIFVGDVWVVVFQIFSSEEFQFPIYLSLVFSGWRIGYRRVLRSE